MPIKRYIIVLCAQCFMYATPAILCGDHVVDTLLFTPRGIRGIWVSNITAEEKTRDSASFAFLYNIPFDIQLIVLQCICAHIIWRKMMIRVQLKSEKISTSLRLGFWGNINHLRKNVWIVKKQKKIFYL